MYRKIRAILAGLLLLALLPCAAGAQQQSTPYEFDKRNLVPKAQARPANQSGWYGYEFEQEPKEEQPVDEQAPKHAPMPVLSVEELWKMHPDDFQEYTSKVTKQAVQNPTEANVLLWFRVKEVAVNKSAAFAGVVSYLGQKYPQLTNESVAPVSSPGLATKEAARYNNIVDKIVGNANAFGLVMFVEPNNEFVVQQQKIVKMFLDKYSWPMNVVDVSQNPDARKRFGIESLPMIILVKREDDSFLPVANGVTSLTSIEASVYRSIRVMNNEITPEQSGTFDFQMESGLNPLRKVDEANKVNIDVLRPKTP